ncbi:hypothetical protein J2847_004901 [Azospirillum agricola]|uniref:hypothetical protein n=1 Tax=Azospirillum agricola TaxID=1720247 RepID=UPI001AEB2CDE|nr:hypothetical protein [Azospirillum agricola]MBP2231582.1 hypothetical protein [Azospirillum agricola]
MDMLDRRTFLGGVASGIAGTLGIVLIIERLTFSMGSVLQNIRRIIDGVFGIRVAIAKQIEYFENHKVNFNNRIEKEANTSLNKIGSNCRLSLDYLSRKSDIDENNGSHILYEETCGLTMNIMDRILFSPTYFYNEGSYVTPLNKEIEILCQAAVNYIIEMKSERSEYSDILIDNIDVTFIGVADAKGRKKILNVVYAGEFGNKISIDSKFMDYSLDDKKTDRKTIENGERISNGDLAFLRAYGLFLTLKYEMGRLGIGISDLRAIKFNVKESLEIGKKYRSSSIILKATYKEKK